VPASLWERNLKKLKQRICCQKPLLLFFSLSGLPNMGREKQNYVLVVNENFKPFSKKTAPEGAV